MQCRMCGTGNAPIAEVFLFDHTLNALMLDRSLPVCDYCRWTRDDLRDSVTVESVLGPVRARARLTALPVQIALDLLHDNPYQPRTQMDEEALQQLTETIVAQGFQGVLVAREHPQIAGAYQLTAGHRRREAAKRAGLIELPVVVAEIAEREMVELAATENLQREDLTALEEGKLFQMMSEQMEMSQVEIASVVKKARNYVRNRLRLAEAPQDVQEFVTAKPDSLSAVAYLAALEDPAERAPIIEQLLNRTLLTEDLPAYIESLKQGQQTAEQINEAVAPAVSLQVDSQSIDAAAQDSPEAGIDADASSPLPTKKERTRAIKLGTIVRTLTTCQQALKKDQQPLSPEERTLLEHIVEQAGEMLAS